MQLLAGALPSLYGIIVLLIVGRTGGYDWISFHVALEGQIKGTIHIHQENGASTSLAKRIVQSLYSTIIDGRLGGEFGVLYTAIVWENEIRPAFADVVTAGTPQYVTPNSRRLTCGEGMMPLLWSLREGPSTSQNSIWPCLKGGSVAVTAATAHSIVMNCMVFYNAPEQGLVNGEDHLGRTTGCHSLIQLCEGEHDRFTRAYAAPIDLTSLARCIFKNYPNALEVVLRNKCVKLRGVAAFPSYREPRDESSGYALHSDNGRFFLTCTTDIPIVNIQEHPTFAVCYGILFSETYS